jgi:hypothetical protein
MSLASFQRWTLVAGCTALLVAAYSQDAATEPAAAAGTKKVGSSTSASKQFVVHGGDLNLRSSFCLLSEDTSVSLGRLLKDEAKFAIPVVVVLKTPPEVSQEGPPITTSISQLAHGGFHLQMNVQMRPDFRSEDFSRELVRVLLAERILRNHQELSTQRQRVLPDWLLTGVTQAMEFRSRSRPSALFAAVFRSGQVYSIDRILAADPAQLDALARGIYETSSCALVLALLDQPDSSLRFGKFLNALATDNKPDRELLQQHFPTLGISKNSLEKWWTLEMAHLATPTAMETMSVSETEEALDNALTLRFTETAPGKKSSTRKPVAKPEAEPAPEPEKKSGGFFGFGRKKTEDEPKPEEKAKESPPEKAQEVKPPVKEDKPKAEEPAKPKEEDDRPRFRLPFGGGKKVIFPFDQLRGKKDNSSPEEPAKKDEEKKVEKPKPAPKTKPEAAPEKPKEKPQPKEEPVVPAIKSLPRKPSDTRKVSSQPDDLPETKPQPAPAPKKEAFKAPEPKSEDKPEVEPEKPQTAASSPVLPRPESLTTPKPKDGTSAPLEDFAMIAKRSDRSLILQRTLDNLNGLALRAHPLYKPLIAEYKDAVQKLLQGKDKDVLDQLTNLRNQRSAIRDKAVAVESYLDWYEATETQNYSGTFDDYLNLHRKMDEEIKPRTDAISKYLDALEKEYE